jgi:hypothetical protein
MYNPGYINKYMSEKSNDESQPQQHHPVMQSSAQPLDTPQLLQAYLDIGGFRRNTERNATDPCIMNAILSVLDKR